MRTTNKIVPTIFKWRHFEPEIILLCVRWYLSYRLSYRDLVEMMDERGLKIAHTTILRWVLKFSYELKKRVRPHLKKPKLSWRLDETYIKVKGKWLYLFRAVDKDGNTIDFYLSKKRDYQAALHFFKKIIHRRSPHCPETINVDGNGAYTLAKRKLEKEGKWPEKLKLRQNKYVNNIIEQDHRRVKWKMNHAMGYSSHNTATDTITGIETIHKLRKGQVPFQSKREPQLLCNYIHRLFDIPGSIFPVYLNRKLVF